MNLLCLEDFEHCVNDIIREISVRILTPGHMRRLLSETNALSLIRRHATSAHWSLPRTARKFGEPRSRLGWGRTRFPLEFRGSAAVRARARTACHSGSGQSFLTQWQASTFHKRRKDVSRRVLCYRATALARALLNRVEVVLRSNAHSLVPEDACFLKKKKKKKKKKNNPRCFNTFGHRGFVSLKKRSIPFLLRWKKPNTKEEDGQRHEAARSPHTEIQPLSHAVETRSLRLELEEYKKELKMSKEIISRQTQQLTQLSMQVADLKSVCEASATENELPLDKEEARRLEQLVWRLRQKNAELEMQLEDQATHARQAFEMRCALQEAQLVIRSKEAELQACRPILTTTNGEAVQEPIVSLSASQAARPPDCSVPSQSSSASSTFGDAVLRASVSEFDSEQCQEQQPRCDQLLNKVSEWALEAKVQLEREDLQKQLCKAQESCAAAERRLAHREAFFRRWHRRKQREIFDLHELVEYERLQRESENQLITQTPSERRDAMQRTIASVAQSPVEPCCLSSRVQDKAACSEEEDFRTQLEQKDKVIAYLLRRFACDSPTTRNARGPCSREESDGLSWGAASTDAEQLDSNSKWPSTTFLFKPFNWMAQRTRQLSSEPAYASPEAVVTLCQERWQSLLEKLLIENEHLRADLARAVGG